ncbi:MAG TPA: peptide chain release factor N(5)-glutamine methyltransferase [Polyangiaceae bacterium]|nr:peptide chain release factor N(5)-glutamine methyltransferase [Polyangiaceae bacterium]
MTSPTTPPAAWTVEAVLAWATADFRARGIDTPRLDAELLLGRALQASRIALIVDAKRVLDAAELGAFRELVKRRRERQPIAYILGEREFYGRTFRVDPRVLVPRPDTEALVEVALERTRSLSMSARGLDLCTGSGCVAITIARERPTSRVVATDVSAAAIDVARNNAQRLGAYNVAFLPGDLYAAVPGEWRFDLITANPPYVPSGEIADLQPEVRDHEPRAALDGGDDGMTILCRVVSGAADRLRHGGVLAVEVGAGESTAIAARMENAGFDHVEIRRDYGRIERVVSAVLRAP